MIMALYRNPQARAQILGGEQTPEKTEIAHRILTKGLSSIMPNKDQGSAAPVPVDMGQGSAAPVPVDMGQGPAAPAIPPYNLASSEPGATAPDSMGTKAVLERMERMQRLLEIEKWVTNNENTPVPWDENLTWGDYLSNIFEKQGDEARDAIVEEQLKKEEESLPPAPLPKGQIDTMAPMAPQSPPGIMAEAPMVPQSPPGIMAAAEREPPRFALGGINSGPVLPYDPLPPALLPRELLEEGGENYDNWKKAAKELLGPDPVDPKTSGGIRSLTSSDFKAPGKSFWSGLTDRPLGESADIFFGDPNRVAGLAAPFPGGGLAFPHIANLASNTIKEGWEDQQRGGPSRTGMSPGGLPFLVRGGVLTTADYDLTLERAIKGLNQLDRVNRERQERIALSDWEDPKNGGETKINGDTKLPTIARKPGTLHFESEDWGGYGSMGEGPSGVSGAGLDVVEAQEEYGTGGEDPTFNTGGLVTADRLRGLAGFARGGMNPALGSMNPAPGGPPVGEEEFMAALSQLSNEAEIPKDQLSAVAEEATRVTDGSMAVNDNVMDSGIMQTVEAVEATDEDMSGIGSLTEISSALTESGEEGLIHATPGEIVFDPSRLPDNERNMLFAALDAAGIDPAAITVGDPANILNEMTGLPAFGFWSKIWKKVKGGVKKVGKFLKKNAGTILGIAGAMTGNPWLAALGSGVGSLIEGKPIQSALVSAGLSFAGTKWVGPWIGEQLQGIEALGIGKSLQTPIGTAAEGLLPSGEFGAAIGRTATEGVAAQTAERAAMKAALDTGLTFGSGAINAANQGLMKKAAETALMQNIPSSIFSSVYGAGGQAISDTASKIAASAAQQIAGGAATSAAATALPYGGISSFLQSAAATPIGDVIGGSIAGYGAKAAQPMVEAMITGVPAADEQDVLDAWNQRYSYTPSSSELYQFYTSDYLPNQQVNIGSTIGNIPGYSSLGNLATPPILAAGGGYIDGAGGPKSDSNLARLSNGEFVMTEAAVRGAGYGDRILGAKRMYDIMNGLERRAA
jgi:hypothetical protein